MPFGESDNQQMGSQPSYQRLESLFKSIGLDVSNRDHIDSAKQHYWHTNHVVLMTTTRIKSVQGLLMVMRMRMFRRMATIFESLMMTMRISGGAVYVTCLRLAQMRQERHEAQAPRRMAAMLPS